MNRQEITKKVRQIVHQLVWEQGHVSPLDIFVGMGKLSPVLVKEWRRGNVPYLEGVIQGNLNQFSFIMKEFRKITGEWELKPSYQAYLSQGKGSKRVLRFSKSGNPHIEQAYATRYIKQAKDQPAVREPAESGPIEE